MSVVDREGEGGGVLDVSFRREFSKSIFFEWARRVPTSVSSGNRSSDWEVGLVLR